MIRKIFKIILLIFIISVILSIILYLTNTNNQKHINDMYTWSINNNYRKYRELNIKWTEFRKIINENKAYKSKLIKELPYGIDRNMLNYDNFEDLLKDEILNKCKYENYILFSITITSYDKTCSFGLFNQTIVFFDPLN